MQLLQAALANALTNRDRIQHLQVVHLVGNLEVSSNTNQWYLVVLQNTIYLVLLSNFSQKH